MNFQYIFSHYETLNSFVEPVLRIRNVYPGSPILIFTHPGSRILDLGSRIQKQQQKRGVKKISCSNKFYKIEII
jgi:hypothetical protein